MVEIQCRKLKLGSSLSFKALSIINDKYVKNHEISINKYYQEVKIGTNQIM